METGDDDDDSQCMMHPFTVVALCLVLVILFVSRPRSEGRPHHGRSLLSPFISVLFHSD